MSNGYKNESATAVANSTVMGPDISVVVGKEYPATIVSPPFEHIKINGDRVFPYRDPLAQIGGLSTNHRMYVNSPTGNPNYWSRNKLGKGDEVRVIINSSSLLPMGGTCYNATLVEPASVKDVKRVRPKYKRDRPDSIDILFGQDTISIEEKKQIEFGRKMMAEEELQNSD